jgi:CheY-like chemotaxis protein
MHSDPIFVLVVEDEALIRIGMVDDLEQAGFTVLEAQTSDEAMRLLRGHPEIQVLFTDINMPGSMDGLRLAETVHDRWPPIKIIITSGGVRLRQGDLPDDALFVPKPYDNNDVISALREMVLAA